MELLAKLGLAGQRVLMVHHDDLGLTHAQNGAFTALALASGSVMIPASWATGLRGSDLGVHLVLTSEWEAPKTRPLTGGQSLTDSQGFFHRSPKEVWERARAVEVEAELRAQIEASKRLFQPTHLDTHQGAVLRPDLAEIYLRLAASYRLPVYVPDDLERLGVPEAFVPDLERLMATAPFPRVRFLDPYGLSPENRIGFYLDLANLGSGLYYLVHHSALPTPEGRALPDWETREADYFALAHPEVRRVLSEFHILTWKTVQEAL